MDALIDAIKTKRSVSENTIKTYKRHWTKIQKMCEAENFSCFDDCEKVCDIFMNSNASQSSIRSYLASLVVLREAEGKDFTKYQELMKKMNEDIKAQNAKHEKTEKQKTNWTTLSELQKIVKDYQNELTRKGIFNKTERTKADNDLLKKFIIGMLYVGDPDNHPPVRLDYAPMRIISESDYKKLSEHTENYLIIISRNKKQFAFNDYKTKKTHGEQIFDVSPKINTALNKYLKNHKGDYLLNNNKSVMSANSLGKFITKTFEPSGKNITINIIRHIFVSETLPPEVITKQKQDAVKMLHNSKVHELYSKQD